MIGQLMLGHRMGVRLGLLNDRSPGQSATNFGFACRAMEARQQHRKGKHARKQGSQPAIPFSQTLHRGVRRFHATTLS